MTNNKQQTAVEWLVAHLTEYGFDLQLHKVEIDQAKEMEKEQHNKTWESSRLGYTGDSFRDSVFGQVKDFSEYYEETYGGNT